MSTLSPTKERAQRRQAFGAPHVFVLVAVDGAEGLPPHRVASSETIAGRDDRCDFRIEDDQVSKQHFRLRVEGGVCTIHDMHSRNGTRVNGRSLRPGTAQRIRHLDEVVVGGVRLLVLHGKFRVPGPGGRR